MGDVVSRFNKGAPEYTRMIQHEVHSDEKLQDSLRQSLKKFCWFLGLEIHGEGKKTAVRKAEHFGERVGVCWSGIANHNWLRISRVLHSLKLSKLDVEAAAFMACLEIIAKENDDVSGKTYGTPSSLVH